MKTKIMKLSQFDMAVKTGISPACLSQLKNGQRAGTIETLEKMLDAVGMSDIDLDDCEHFFPIITRIRNMMED